jgi:hypothetical protein
LAVSPFTMIVVTDATKLGSSYGFPFHGINGRQKMHEDDAQLVKARDERFVREVVVWWGNTATKLKRK